MKYEIQRTETVYIVDNRVLFNLLCPTHHTDRIISKNPDSGHFISSNRVILISARNLYKRKLAHERHESMSDVSVLLSK